MMNKYLLLGAAVVFSFASCNHENSGSQKLKDGKWHAEFNAKDGNIPFVFDVTNGTSDSAATVTLINGDERVALDGIRYSGDSVYIPIKAYDTQLSGVIAGDTLRGMFKRLFSENDPGVAFTAVYGNTPRFERKGAPAGSLEGKWYIQFISEDKTDIYVGIFAQ
jgi:hypothetical protein